MDRNPVNLCNFCSSTMTPTNSSPSPSLSLPFPVTFQSSNMIDASIEAAIVTKCSLVCKIFVNKITFINIIRHHNFTTFSLTVTSEHTTLKWLKLALKASFTWEVFGMCNGVQFTTMSHGVTMTIRQRLCQVLKTRFHSARKKIAAMYERGPGKNKQSLPRNTVISHGFPAD